MPKIGLNSEGEIWPLKYLARGVRTSSGQVESLQVANWLKNTSQGGVFCAAE